ncbi:hypothetical protein IFM89_030263 [Coptis chinensis]|uniref:Uncharacterized protein n=1 Tax=Coptis chinensis TaxID=261450 RepID=A0A835HU17_9MAGN|nr:hypothetical protein IFM89_030263 [Coptis chinensis]
MTFRPMIINICGKKISSCAGTLDEIHVLSRVPVSLGSKDTQEYHWLRAVHVKDVSIAQVLLFETPSASGRYLCTNGIYQFRDFAHIVSRRCMGLSATSAS